MIDDIRLIAAVGRRGQLGLNGTIPWNESRQAHRAGEKGVRVH